MTHTAITPLDAVEPGRQARIERIESGRGLVNRLAAMGLFKNEIIRIIRNDGAGQIIVGVKNSKVILGRGMSHKVFVTRL